jgi:glycosyltransferase involved in cell wall biosynthesis
MPQPDPNQRVALVVPMLNEAASLPLLLMAIQFQTRRPDEIIFVDAGSTDTSKEVVFRWWKEHGWFEGVCKVETNSGGYPGHNRNAGVKAASCEWIAFIDCGILPDPDWLEHLLEYANRTSAQAVFGMCDFFADGVVARAACALSYGVGSEHPVLPASLFHRSVFDKTGMFEENLRAAEDIKWMALLKSWAGPKVVCAEARVHYCVFPSTIPAVFRKWYLYKKHVIRARIGIRNDVMQLLLALGWIILFVKSPALALSVLLAYAMLRGAISPMKYSKPKTWWVGEPLALAAAPIVALAMDMAKLAAMLNEYPKCLRNISR